MVFITLANHQNTTLENSYSKQRIYQQISRKSLQKTPPAYYLHTSIFYSTRGSVLS